jgi:hypothetical protein
LAYYANRWSVWLRRYLVLCVVWSVVNIVLIVLIGSLAG